MTIGVLIPTRDRPIFLNHACEMISRQTRQPDHLLIVDEPTEHEIDLNYRYRIGLKKLFAEGCDCVVLWEDDDWYCPEYIEIMTNGWAKDWYTLYGLNKTIYYHLRSGKYSIINHPDRCSAMSMVVGKKILDIEPPRDDDKDFDLYYCSKIINKCCVSENRNLNLGIKHGIGTCGGKGHNESLSLYKNGIKDIDNKFLKNTTGQDFYFYDEIRRML